jgi:hypothetical protein
MRRLVIGLVMLSGLAACQDVPDWIDATPDRYLEMRPSPDRMVNESGNYNGGWYSEFTGRINPEDASGDDYTFKTWLHFNIDDPAYYIVAQLVVTDIAGNLAMTITDKATGAFHEADVVYTFGDEVQGDTAATSFTDSATGSFIKLDGGALSFDVKSNGLRVAGSAEAIFERPLVQITRYHDGYGDLVFWGNIRVTEWTVTVDDRESPLAVGSLGLYDRSIGHKRTTLNWNYVAVSGEAVNEATGERALFALQGSVDLPRTRPRVDHKCHGLWLDGALYKPSSIFFDYDITDQDRRTTSDWHLHSPAGETASYDLTVRPASGQTEMFHRRNKSSSLWFFERDFSQYYGVASGTVTVNGVTWVITDVYALLEDAYVVL